MTHEIFDSQPEQFPQSFYQSEISDADWDVFARHIKSLEPGSKAFKNFMLRADIKGSPCGELYDEYTEIVRYASAIRDSVPLAKNQLPVIEQYFFQNTPVYIQLELLDKFPQEFQIFIPDVREKIDSIFQVIEHNPDLSRTKEIVLTYAPLLPNDKKNYILSAFGSIIDNHLKEQSTEAFGHVGVELMTTLANQRESELTKTEEQNVIDERSLFETTPEHTVDILRQFFRQLVDNGNNPYADEIIQNLKEEVILPVIFSAVYKRMSRSWNAYMESSGSLDELPEFIQSESDKILTEYYGDFLSLNPELHSITSRFSDIAAFLPEISFFNTEDMYGNKQYLFLHQVEAISKFRSFIEGGMLTDDPGLGKTIMLALTSIHELQKLEPTIDNPRRILIVGTKAVLATWEREIIQRLHMLDIEAINPTKQIDVYVRLKQIQNFIEHPQHPIQFVMVNLDMFRNNSFQRFMEEGDFFDDVIIDEAHHIKSKDSNLLQADFDADKIHTSTAERTAGIYKYAKEHLLKVYLATATPFVIDTNEPLALAHLISPDVFTREKVKQLSESPELVFAALKECVIRRKKSEVADLPSRSARVYHLDMLNMSEEKQHYFLDRAREIETTSENSFAYFYKMLSLESEMKQDWLIQKVNSLTAEGKKIVIFTPFVNIDRMTGDMSTARLANLLSESGIPDVGILDGTLTQTEVDEIKNRFHLPISTEQSLSVLIGNYKTAGESITLSSPENHASEVILYVAPDTAARLLQAIDRIHRFGQVHDVHIHIPMIENDLLGRNKDTYDSRIIKRLLSRVRKYQAIVDSVFYVEPSNIFQTIILEIKYGEKKSTTHTPVEYTQNAIDPETSKIIQTLRSSIRQHPKGKRIFKQLTKNSIPELSYTQKMYAFMNIFLNITPGDIHSKFLVTKQTNIVQNAILEAKVKIFESMGTDFFNEDTDITFPTLSIQRIKDLHNKFSNEPQGTRFPIIDSFFGNDTEKGKFRFEGGGTGSLWSYSSARRDLNYALSALERFAEYIQYDAK